MVAEIIDLVLKTDNAFVRVEGTQPLLACLGSTVFPLQLLDNEVLEVGFSPKCLCNMIPRISISGSSGSSLPFRCSIDASNFFENSPFWML